MSSYPFPSTGASPAPTASSDPTAVIGRRIGAAVVDFLLFLLIMAFVTATPLSPLAEYFDTDENPGIDCEQIEDLNDVSSCTQVGDRIYFTETGDAPIQFVVFLAIVLGYSALQGATGRTPGKALFGLKVVDEQGERPGFGKSILRTILWVVDAAPWCLPLVGFITGLTTKGHRRVGDMAAKTFVVGKAHQGPVQVPGLATAATGGYPGGYGAPGPSWGAPPPGAGAPAGGWGTAPAQGQQPGAWGAPAPGGFPPVGPGSTGASSPTGPPSGEHRPAPPSGSSASGTPSSDSPSFGPGSTTPRSSDSPSSDSPSFGPTTTGQSSTGAASTDSPPFGPSSATPAPSGSAPTDAGPGTASPAGSSSLSSEGSSGSPATPGDTAGASGPSDRPSPPEAGSTDAPAGSGPSSSTIGSAGAPTTDPAPAAGGPSGESASPAPGQADATAPAQAAPSGYNPQWDAARGTYIVWEPNRGKWLGWDEAAKEWKPL